MPAKRKLKNVGLTREQFEALLKVINLEDISEHDEYLLSSAKIKFQTALEEMEGE